MAARAGAGLMLEAPTWRANPDWAAIVGYDAAALDRVNRAASSCSTGCARSTSASSASPTSRSAACTDPEETGTSPARRRPRRGGGVPLRPGAVGRGAGAELVTALTLTGAGEAIGFVRAVRDTGLPVAVGFTVETDGRLPDGTTLKDAIERVDAAAPPDYYVVNCAHPTHVAPALEGDGPWSRIEGLRPNASRMSHAELDAAPELDEGDPADLAVRTDALRASLPNLRILGGCCGTDSRHVAALWGVG